MRHQYQGAQPLLGLRRVGWERHTDASADPDRPLDMTMKGGLGRARSHHGGLSRAASVIGPCPWAVNRPVEAQRSEDT